nr:MAG TPA: hypothetical protein [Caudoviricetes sp.]
MVRECSAHNSHFTKAFSRRSAGSRRKLTKRMPTT